MVDPAFVVSAVAVAELPVQIAAVVAVDALPVKLPSTLPLRLPLIVLVNLAKPVTNKESAVKLSTSVSFLKVVLLLKILAPVIICFVSVVTRLGLFVTLAQSTDFSDSAGLIDAIFLRSISETRILITTEITKA